MVDSYILIGAMSWRAAAEKNIIESSPLCFSKQTGESKNTYTPGKRKREREEERCTRGEFMLRLFVTVCLCMWGVLQVRGKRGRERERERERETHFSCNLTWKISEIERLIVMLPFLHTYTRESKKLLR